MSLLISGSDTVQPPYTAPQVSVVFFCTSEESNLSTSASFCVFTRFNRRMLSKSPFASDTRLCRGCRVCVGGGSSDTIDEQKSDGSEQKKKI